MARQAKSQRLTKETILQIRSTHAAKASALLRRLRECAEGQVDMTPTQVKAALGVIGHVLPAMQSVQVEDVTETTQDRAGVEAAYKQAMNQLKAQLRHEDITQVLATMDKDTRQALIDSIDAGKQ